MKYLILVIFSLLLYNCKTDDTQQAPKAHISYHNFNLVIAPDLSNRIDPKTYAKPIHDTVIVARIYDSIFPALLKLEGRTMGQKDIYKLDFLNPKYLNGSTKGTAAYTVDFRKFEGKQLNRANYINKELARDIKLVKSEIRKLYEEAALKPIGADVFAYLNSGVNRSLRTDKQEVIETEEGVFTFDSRNVVLILTDGYIENTNKEKGYNLGKKEIEAIRAAFTKSGEPNLGVFLDKNQQYQLTPLQNPRLKEVNLLVAELFDRSVVNGTEQLHPTDRQIIETVWRDWLKKSGIGGLKFMPMASSSEEVLEGLKGFMVEPDKP